MSQRLASKNALINAVVVPSSEEPGVPAAALRDPSRRNFWRTKTGWNIVAGFNDRLDFSTGAGGAAAIPVGNYFTGTLMAAAIQAALEAADPTPVWSVVYDVDTHTFTIASDMAFTLLWNSGPNAHRSIGEDLGFSATDTASAVSHTALNTSHQGRHFVTIDTGSPVQVVRMVALAEHNIGADGPCNVRLQGNPTDVWSAPTFNIDISAEVAAKGEKVLRAYFSDPNVRYFRLVVTDTYNPDGFLDLGLLWLGTYLEIEDRLERTVINQPEDFTRFEQGPDGVLFVDFGRARDRLTLVWRPLAGTDLTSLRSFLGALQVGEAWMLDLDGAGAGQVYYGSFMARPNDTGITHEVAVIAFEFVVAL